MAASERPRRANAGKKIGTLLDQELDGDEFYKNAYGGFDEVSEDGEYEVQRDFRKMLEHVLC